MFLRIVLIMLVLFVMYYIVMISLDLYRAKLDDQMKANADNEQEIDISEEVSQFSPTEITREEKKPVNNQSPISNDDMIHDNIEDIVSDEVVPDNVYPEFENHETEKSLLNEDTDTLLDTLGQIPEDIRDSSLPNQNQEYETSDYRRSAISDDGVEVSELLSKIEELAQKGKSDMGDIIYMCQDAA